MALEQVGVVMIAQGASAFFADMASASKAVAGFGASVDKSAGLVQDAEGRWRTASGRFASNAEKAAAGVAGVAPAAKSAGDAIVQAGADAERGGHGFNAFGEIVKGALREAGAAALNFGIQAAKATAGFVKDSIGAAGDFQQGMLEFQSVAGQDVDAKGLKQFHDLFLQLGKDLPVSTSEVERAAIEMVKGGIDPAIVAAGGLKQNIQFAAAAMKGDLAGAAEVSAKILGGWSDAGATAAQQAAFLTHSTDLLTKAANASSVDVKELSLGIFNAQGIARTAGVSFDDLTTVLAELAPRFASSSEAGTSLKNMIARLQPTTKKATAAMQDLGLITEEGNNKFYDAKGNFVGMSQASQLLQNAMKGLTKQQQAATLQMIFGNDAMGSAAGLAELGAAGYDEMAAKMAKANGVAAAAALIQQSFNTKMDNAKGSVEALQITIGTQLLPVIGDLLDNTITPGINTLTTFAGAIFGDKDAMASLSGPLLSTATYVKDVAKAFEGWYSGALSLKTALDVLSPGLGSIVAPAQAVVAEFTRLSTAFDTGGLSGLISTLTSDISAALPTIQTKLGEWGLAFVDFAKPYVAPMLAALGSAVDQAWGWIKEQAPGWLAQLGVWGSQLWGWIQPMIAPALAELGKLASQAWTWIKEQAPGWGEQLKSWSSQLWSWVQPYIPQAIDALGKLVNAAWAWVKDQAPGWGEQLKLWGSQLWGWIQPMIAPTLAKLGDLATQLWGWISAQAAPLLVKLGEWTTSFTSWVPGATVKFLAEWPKMFDAFLGWIGNQAGPLLLKFGDWAVSMISWILPKIPDFVVALGGIAAAALIFIGETTVVLAKKVLEWSAAILGWVGTDVLPKLPGILHDIDTAMWKWADAAKTALYNTMLDVGTGLVDGMRKGISNAWSGMESYLHNLAMQLPDWFRAWYNIKSPSTLMAQTVGEPLVQGIGVGMLSALSGMQPVITQVSDTLLASYKTVTDEIRAQVTKTTDEITAQVKSAQSAIANLVISGYGATANIDRQKLSNLDTLGTIAEGRQRTQAQAQLEDAEREAAVIQDPKQAADYFKMRSEQIIELAKLQDQFNAETDAREKKRLSDRMTLVEHAQGATRQEFAAQSVQDTAISGIVSTLNSILSNPNLPPFLGDPVLGPLHNMLDRLTSPAASPAYIGGTAAWQGGDTYGPTLNMPIYTNMSPSAIQQSAAIAGAML